MKIVQISKVRSGMLFQSFNRPGLGLCTLIYKGSPRPSARVGWPRLIVPLVYLSSRGHLHDENVATCYIVKIPVTWRDDG